MNSLNSIVIIFSHQVLSAYNIVLKENDEFELTDQLNTPIDWEMLEEVILKYEKCSDFVVKFVFKGNAAKMSMMNEVCAMQIEVVFLFKT